MKDDEAHPLLGNDRTTKCAAVPDSTTALTTTTTTKKGDRGVRLAVALGTCAFVVLGVVFCADRGGGGGRGGNINTNLVHNTIRSSGPGLVPSDSDKKRYGVNACGDYMDSNGHDVSLDEALSKGGKYSPRGYGSFQKKDGFRLVHEGYLWGGSCGGTCKSDWREEKTCEFGFPAYTPNCRNCADSQPCCSDGVGFDFNCPGCANGRI